MSATKQNEQTKGSGSDAPTCSASSETPETDAAWSKHATTHVQRAHNVKVVCEKLERQRNAAWKTLKEIRELFTADESFGATVEALFAKPLEDAEAEIARLKSLLNADVLAPAGEKTPTKKKDV